MGSFFRNANNCAYSFTNRTGHAGADRITLDNFHAGADRITLGDAIRLTGIYANSDQDAYGGFLNLSFFSAKELPVNIIRKADVQIHVGRKWLEFGAP